ncbi:MAG: HPF/RaiA family ribosome-associated protein [Acidimicrobiia bacterium]
MRSSTGPVPTRLRSMTARKLDRLARVAPDASRADVHLSEERNPRIAGRHACSITVQMRQGSVVAHAAAATPELALERVLDKIRHQVARLKDRRVRSPHGAGPRRGRRVRTRS